MKKLVCGFDSVTSTTPNAFVGILLVVWPVIFICFIQYTCLNHDFSLLKSLKSYLHFFDVFVNFYLNPMNVSLRTVKYLIGWQTFQLFLYLCLPGKMTKGRVMKSGRVLDYKCNGLYALLISNITVILMASLKFIDPVYFINHIHEFLILSNFLGLLLTAVVYIKAHIAPNNKDECYFSGSSFYDFYSGVEHSPRIGNFDFKQFFNARVGIALWPLINLSYATKMYQTYGTISYSMILLNLLQFAYVFDLFVFEDWYMRTIDIAYDHFGFYLSWGDLVWLPFMYTLQGFFLSSHFVKLSLPVSIITTILGFASIYFFRKSNNQKEEFRAAKARGKEYMINGKGTSYIEAHYISEDKKDHISYLLVGGYWKMARHFNYLTDLGNALSYSLCCGTTHFLPYFYFIYMIILLLHRIERDDIRCHLKYKHHWDCYCKLVPYKLIPYVY